MLNVNFIVFRLKAIAYKIYRAHQASDTQKETKTLLKLNQGVCLLIKNVKLIMNLFTSSLSLLFELGSATQNGIVKTKTKTKSMLLR